MLALEGATTVISPAAASSLEVKVRAMVSSAEPLERALCASSSFLAAGVGGGKGGVSVYV